LDKAGDASHGHCVARAHNLTEDTAPGVQVERGPPLPSYFKLNVGLFEDRFKRTVLVVQVPRDDNVMSHRSPAKYTENHVEYSSETNKIRPDRHNRQELRFELSKLLT
jgi:hypothetical protein